MFNFKKVFLILLLTTIYSFGETMIFSEVSRDTKLFGLRNFGAAIDGGLSSMRINPAHIVKIERRSYSINYQKFMDGMYQTGVAISDSYGQGSWGASLDYYNGGIFKEAKTDREFTPYELIASIFYGEVVDFKYIGSLNMGASCKLHYSKISEYNSSALSVDFGIQKSLPANFSLGLTFNNLGLQIDKYMESQEHLPLSLKTAVSKQLEKIPLVVLLQYNYYVFSDDMYGVALEFHPKENLYIRAGYDLSLHKNMSYDGNDNMEKFSGLGLGLTVLAFGYDFNFGYNINGVLENKFMIGISSSVMN